MLACWDLVRVHGRHEATRLYVIGEAISPDNSWILNDVHAEHGPIVVP